MLFGDAVRDIKLAPSRKNNDIGAHTRRNSTEDHLGPGAYQPQRNIRAGWVKRSYSTKQPMSPSFDTRKERQALHRFGY